MYMNLTGVTLISSLIVAMVQFSGLIAYIAAGPHFLNPLNTTLMS